MYNDEGETGPRVMPERLKEFATKVFIKMGVPAEDAATVADVLVAADIRGVRSHGIARLHMYINRLENGTMKPVSDIKIVSETLATARIDGGGGMGHPISKFAMELAMEKARAVGAGFVTVFNSSHYGIAGYWSMMALEQDMIDRFALKANLLNRFFNDQCFSDLYSDIWSRREIGHEPDKCCRTRGGCISLRAGHGHDNHAVRSRRSLQT